MNTIELNGINISYDDVGVSDNVLVLVHGHPFNRSMWIPQVETVSGFGWRVIAPDLRGYGETSVVSGKTTLDIFAADVAVLLGALCVDRVVIAGLSMGGQITMEFARQYPARVRAIVLAATFPRPESEAGRRNRIDTASRLLRDGMDDYALELLPKMLAASSIATMPTLASHVLEMMRRTSPEGAAAALRGRAERPDYKPVLASLDVPALIVVGAEDAFTTRGDADEMHALLRQSELVWMEGVGHMPNLERPAQFNTALRNFLERV